MSNKRMTCLALAAVMITFGALWLTNRAVTPREATWTDVLAEAKIGGYRIITSEELAKLYRNDPKHLLLVDTRQEWEFRTGHVKGAQNFPMEPTWWSRRQKAPALEAFLGPDKDRLIVFY
ncbi:MAG: rhodanese-like domain-containing protein [Deltaproteobacteria bacterium]|nr:rhodanese-like domain-containing protein [Deltaproteobacteria bacterium]